MSDSTGSQTYITLVTNFREEVKYVSNHISPQGQTQWNTEPVCYLHVLMRAAEAIVRGWMPEGRSYSGRPLIDCAVGFTLTDADPFFF